MQLRQLPLHGHAGVVQLPQAAAQTGHLAQAGRPAELHLPHAGHQAPLPLPRLPR